MKTRILIIAAAIVIFSNIATSLVATYIVRNEDVYHAGYAALPTPDPIASVEVKKTEETIDIREIPLSLFPRYWGDEEVLPHNTEYNVMYRDSDNKSKRVTYKGQRIDSLQYAPLSTINEDALLLGFYYDTQPNISGSDVALVIMNTDTGEMKEVYHGGFKTSSWEWDGSERVIVYYGCGTACLYARKIDINTRKEIEGWHVITDYPPASWPKVDPK